MKIHKLTFISSLSVLLAPLFASAQTVEGLAFKLVDWINRGVVILITIATLFFIWAVIGYIRSSKPEERKEKQRQMINGIIGLFVIVSVWGIIGLVSRTLGTNQGGTYIPPCPPGTVWSRTAGAGGGGACI